jgi:hypothetical protein
VNKLENLQSVTDAEVELIKRQSELLLQRRSYGFNGELKTSGSIVENYIKELLKKHVPEGYRICSGYIATTATILNTENLVQHDMIIVDGRIPSLYKFGVSDIEIVPAESVCGIIEIKRTLTKTSITEAISHLKQTKELLENYDNGVKSKTKAANNAAGPTLSVATRSPLYAIIGLSANKDSIEEEYLNNDISSEIREFIDFIWAPSNAFLLRFAEKCISNGKIYMPINVSRNMDHDYEPVTLINYFEQEKNGEIYRFVISMLRTWINNTSGARMEAETNHKYFGINI